MLAFECDYNRGAHPAILKALSETNGQAFPGYGEDEICERAKEKIRQACACPDAQVAFLTGGTQTNQIVIDTMLQPYQGVVCCKTGHIQLHEAGAVEFTGRKVMTLPAHDGKLDASELRAMLKSFWQDESREHMVYPGMVYVSHPTEYGTLYTKAELSAIAQVCREYEMALFLDGARLGYGLMSRRSDMTLADIARLCDVFYIGGTKVGALFGEAVVFTHGNRPAHFVNRIKQHGALLAKGWLLGLQFDTLFTDDLYFEISRHAIDMTERLREGLEKLGCTFFMDSPTNQQFIVLENDRYEKLKKDIRMSLWERPDDQHVVVRLAPSWATTEEEVDQVLELMKS